MVWVKYKRNIQTEISTFLLLDKDPNNSLKSTKRYILRLFLTISKRVPGCLRKSERRPC
jgi:hypothetical protein